MMAVMLPGPAGAAEVLPGGYPDLTITGFARFEAFGGEQDDRAGRDPLAQPRLPQRHRGPRPRPRQERGDGHGVRRDDRVRGRHQPDRQHRRDLGVPLAAAGARCGSATRTASPTTARSARRRSRPAPAASTARRGRSRAPVVFLTNTNDATKIRYYTPSFGGFSVGVSYTPTQTGRSTAAPTTAVLRPPRTATDAMEGQNIVEGGLVYDGEFGGTACWPRWWACAAS